MLVWCKLYFDVNCIYMYVTWMNSILCMRMHLLLGWNFGTVYIHVSNGFGTLVEIGVGSAPT